MWRWVQGSWWVWGHSEWVACWQKSEGFLLIQHSKQSKSFHLGGKERKKSSLTKYTQCDWLIYRRKEEFLPVLENAVTERNQDTDEGRTQALAVSWLTAKNLSAASFQGLPLRDCHVLGLCSRAILLEVMALRREPVTGCCVVVRVRKRQNEEWDR